MCPCFQLTHIVGKDESIWDKFTHGRGGDNGDDSAEGYKRFMEHISHLTDLGVSEQTYY